MIFMLRLARWGVVLGIMLTAFLMFVAVMSDGFSGFLSFAPIMVGLYFFSRFLHRVADDMKNDKKLYKRYGKNRPSPTNAAK